MASAGRPPAASIGLQARGTASRLRRRPAAHKCQSRCLAGPAGASQAFSRASRQYPVLAHGPITVTCTRRNHADEIETPLAVPTCPEPFAGCRSAGGGLSAASDELRPHSIYAHSLDLRSPVGVTRWEFLPQGHSGILSSRYNGDIFLERPREPVARWRETAPRGLFTNHMQVYEVLCE